MKNENPDMRILKIAACPSVSGKSTLTYHVGVNPEGELHLRLYANNAAGFFSQEWVSLKAIDEVLNRAGSGFTSFALQPLFRGKSQNNAAFLLAVLQHTGLVSKATDKKRSYSKADCGPFIAEIQKLLMKVLFFWESVLFRMSRSIWVKRGM